MHKFSARIGRRIDFSGIDLRGEKIGKIVYSETDEWGDHYYVTNKPWDLSYANLSGANLSGMELTEVNFEGCLLINANLSGANLEGADLSYANLSGANLEGADLTYISLVEANLTGANLTRANLGGNTNLDGANFTEANLTAAKLTRVFWDDDKPNLAGANGLETIPNPPWWVREEIQARKDRYFTFLGGIKQSPDTSLRQLYDTKREECIPLREIAQLTGLKKPVSFSTRRRSKKKKIRKKKSKKKSRKRKSN